MLGGAMAFIRAVRELNLNQLRRHILAPVRVLVVGSTPDCAQQLADAVFGDPSQASGTLAVSDLASLEAADQSADLLLAVAQGEDRRELLQRVRASERRATTPLVMVLLDQPASRIQLLSDPAGAPLKVVGADLDSDSLAREVPAAAGALAPELAPAFGRRFPLVRPGAAEWLIREVSGANAWFALLSSLPSFLPGIGGIAGGIADLVVLTRNLGLLLYKLAGLHGRDVDDWRNLALEIGPVVGWAFIGWTVVRSLLGLLPAMLGALPKAAVAYAGTYAVGQMANYYYSGGGRPSLELIARLRPEGTRLAGELLGQLRAWRRPRQSPGY